MNVKNGRYTVANRALNQNKLLKKERNKLLYLLEKGRIYHLLRQADSSNVYFNRADEYIEQMHRNVKDLAIGTLVNPMMQKYTGEDFEKFMIHYYKALNYLYLNQTEEAIVEARRISLQTQQQRDKFNDKENRYSKDVFSLILQGMLYEANDDINNAFIAYRNAAEVYLASKTQIYYGVSMPKQLADDLLRMAYLNGFQGDLTHFEKIFQNPYQPKESPAGGELILFWENGLAPIKTQQEFFFALSKDQAGFYFTDPSGENRFPFVGAVSTSNKASLNSLRSLRVVFPKYVAQPLYYTSATASLSETVIHLEKVEDINELAFQTLRHRFAKEMGEILSRIATKKIAEYAIRGNGQDEAREVLANAVQLYSLFSEKSDTRNWQTLPSAIYYARIPLEKGKNEIQLKMRNTSGSEDSHSITINGNGGLVFYNYVSLK